MGTGAWTAVESPCPAPVAPVQGGIAGSGALTGLSLARKVAPHLPSHTCPHISIGRPRERASSRTFPTWPCSHGGPTLSLSLHGISNPDVAQIPRHTDTLDSFSWSVPQASQILPIWPPKYLQNASVSLASTAAPGPQPYAPTPGLLVTPKPGFSPTPAAMPFPLPSAT